MDRNDPRFEAIFRQVCKLWLAVDKGIPDDIDREQAILATLLEERDKPHES